MLNMSSRGRIPYLITKAAFYQPLSLAFCFYLLWCIILSEKNSVSVIAVIGELVIRPVPISILSQINSVSMQCWDFSFSLSITFIYELILMKIFANAHIMNIQIFIYWSIASEFIEGPIRSSFYLFFFSFSNIFFSQSLILSKFGINANIKKTQFFHNIKSDFKNH